MQKIFFTQILAMEKTGGLPKLAACRKPTKVDDLCFEADFRYTKNVLASDPATHSLHRPLSNNLCETCPLFRVGDGGQGANEQTEAGPTKHPCNVLPRSSLSEA